MEKVFEGKSWVIFVPPGWLLGATVEKETEEYCILKDAIWIESPARDVYQLAWATTPQAQQKDITTGNPIPDGMVVRREAILHAAPCACSFRESHRQRFAKAVKS